MKPPISWTLKNQRERDIFQAGYNKGKVEATLSASEPNPPALRPLIEQLRALPVTAKTCPDDRHETHFCRSQANVSRLQVLFILDQLEALLASSGSDTPGQEKP